MNLTPELQLEKTMMLVLSSTSSWTGNPLENVLVGRVTRRTKFFRSEDFVCFKFDNGGGERWKVTGVSSSGRKVIGHYMHFFKYWPNHRLRRRSKVDGKLKYVYSLKSGREVADVAIVEHSGRPIKVTEVIEMWSDDPAVQRAIVETLLVGSAASASKQDSWHTFSSMNGPLKNHENGINTPPKVVPPRVIGGKVQTNVSAGSEVDKHGTDPMDDTSLMPFGPYNGTAIGKVPATYLDSIRGQPWVARNYPKVYDYIEKYWKFINYELKKGR